MVTKMNVEGDEMYSTTKSFTSLTADASSFWTSPGTMMRRDRSFLKATRRRTREINEAQISSTWILDVDNDDALGHGENIGVGVGVRFHLDLLTAHLLESVIRKVGAENCGLSAANPQFDVVRGSQRGTVLLVCGALPRP